MQTTKFKSLQWINIERPTEDDILVLKKKYKFHELDLEDCLYELQRPKIDEYDKYLFITLHFPNYNKRYKRFDSEQLNIFIGQNYLITLHSGNLDTLSRIIEGCKSSQKKRKEYMGKGAGFLLYEILSEIFAGIFPVTDKIQLTLKRIEQELFESTRLRDQLFDIMVLKKNIITLRNIILPQRTVIAALEHKQKKFLPEDLELYLDDVVDQIEGLWNILSNQKEVIESLEDTNESLLSHNINNTMRTLTVFSVIMLPLTFLTGLFGMNVGLPFADALTIQEHFWNIIGAMLVLSLTMVGIFKWKNWL